MTETKDMLSTQKERAKIGKKIYELGLELLPNEDIFERNEKALQELNCEWLPSTEIFICLTLYLSGEYDE